MTDAPPTAGRRQWLGLVALVLPAALVSMDVSVLFLALPFLSADLAPTGTELLWIMDIYGFLLAGLLITMGNVGDRIGRRRLLMIGAAAFGAASVVAAYSTSAGMLIASRALLGVAGATLGPSTLSLIRSLFHDPAQRRTAIGIWTAAFGGGAILGPLVGGVLLDNFWWGSVFLLNVPVMALLLVAAPRLVPEYRDPAPGRFDLVSAALSLAAVLPAIYGIKELATDGLGWPSLASIAVGLGFGAVFVHRQRQLTHPMLDPRLFKERSFSTAIGTSTLVQFAIMGLSFTSAQFLQLVLGMRPFTAALWSLPGMAGMFAGVAVATILARWMRPARVIAVGMMIGAAGFVVISQVEVDTPLAVLVVGTGCVAAGIAAVAALATDLILSTAPQERAGAAAAVSETSNEFGAALGIALLGSIGAAVYIREVGPAVPAGLPAEAADAARETLGGATEVAAGLPDQLGSALLDAAREAYANGMQATAVVGAVLMVGAAVVTATVLRGVRIRPTDEAETEPAH